MKASGSLRNVFVLLVVYGLLGISRASSLRARSHLRVARASDPLPNIEASEAAEEKRQEVAKERRQTEQNVRERAGDHLLRTTATKVADYHAETPVKIWEVKSTIPFSFEILISVLWIVMVMGLPLYLYVLKGWSVTKTDIVVDSLMLISFVGGLYLFTNVILFESAHFDGRRSLTIVESVYFMAQILTTVGYGDITPALPRGQVFVGCYVICCLLFIANAFSEFVSLTIERAYEKLQERIQHITDTDADGDDAEVVGDAPEVTNDEPKEADPSRPLRVATPPPPISFQNFAGMALVYIFFVVSGVLFFTCYPGEHKTVMEAVYMSVITLSTVGFGAVTPDTEAGKVFASFWMVFGSAALASFVSSFIDVTAQIRAREKWIAEDSLLLSAFADAPPELDSKEFLAFALVSSNIVSKNQLEHVDKLFRQLRPGAKGLISKTSIRDFCEKNNGGILARRSPRSSS